MRLKESSKYKDLIKLNDTTWKYKDKVVIGYNEYGKYYFVSEPEELNWMYNSESLKDLLNSIDNELEDKVGKSMKLKEEFIPNDFGFDCPKCHSKKYVQIEDGENGYGNPEYHFECKDCGYVSEVSEIDAEDLDEVYQQDIILDEDIKETEYNVVIDNIEWAADNEDLPSSIQHDFFLSPYDNLEDEIYKFLLEYSNGVAPLGYSIDYNQEDYYIKDDDYIGDEDNAYHTESLDDEYWSSEENPLDDRYDYVDSKMVYDSDGFITEYTMYYDTLDNKYVFVFGDSDLYKPEDEDFDWECETKDEAEQWFRSYNGFEDELDESKSTKNNCKFTFEAFYQKDAPKGSEDSTIEQSKKIAKNNNFKFNIKEEITDGPNEGAYVCEFIGPKDKLIDVISKESDLDKEDIEEMISCLDECNLKEAQGQNLYLKLRDEIKNSNNIKYLKNLDKKLVDEYLKSLNVDEKEALHRYIVLQIRKINDKSLKEAREEIPWYNKIEQGQPMNIILRGKEVTLKKLQNAPYSDYYINPRASICLGNIFDFSKMNINCWEETIDHLSRRILTDKEMWDLVKTYFEEYPDEIDKYVVLYLPNIKAIKESLNEANRETKQALQKFGSNKLDGDKSANMTNREYLLARKNQMGKAVSKKVDRQKEYRKEIDKLDNSNDYGKDEKKKEIMKQAKSNYQNAKNIVDTARNIKTALNSSIEEGIFGKKKKDDFSDIDDVLNRDFEKNPLTDEEKQEFQQKINKAEKDTKETEDALMNYNFFEDYSENNDVKPFTKKQVYDELKSDTNNFKNDKFEGSYGFLQEVEYAYDILIKHYDEVDWHSEDSRYPSIGDGVDYIITASKNKNESLKEAKVNYVKTDNYGKYGTEVKIYSCEGDEITPKGFTANVNGKTLNATTLDELEKNIINVVNSEDKKADDTILNDSLKEDNLSQDYKKQLEKELVNLLSKPLLASEASDKLYNLLGDNELFDNITDCKNEEGSDYDVRYLVKDWIVDNILKNKNDIKWYTKFDPKAINILKNALKKDSYYKNELAEALNEATEEYKRYLERSELEPQFDKLFDEYKNKIEKKLKIELKDNVKDLPFYKHWCKAYIKLDNTHSITLLLDYSLPDGIYNFISIGYNAELSTKSGKGNIGNLTYDSHTRYDKIKGGFVQAYTKKLDYTPGDLDYTGELIYKGLSIDEFINNIKKEINKYSKDNLKESPTRTKRRK